MPPITQDRHNNDNALDFLQQTTQLCSSGDEFSMRDSEDEDSDTDDDDDDNAFESQALPSHPLVVEPPQVLEPSHYIVKEAGPMRECFGYRFCCDNIDKTIKTRYMRSDKQNVSLHYFHSYAVLNSIDTSQFSETVPDTSKLNIETVANSLLPSVADQLKIILPQSYLEF